MAFASGDVNFTIAANTGDLTRQADGSYLAVWASGATIFGQAFNADGSHKGGQFTVRTLPNTVDPFADISTTLLSNGDTVVTWIEAGSVKAQRLGTDLQPVGTVKDLGSTEVVNQHAPEVYALANGGYTVLYKGNRATDNVVVCTKTTVVGDTVTREPDTAGDDEHHAFAILTDGTFLIFYNNGGSIQLEDWTNFPPNNKELTLVDPPASSGHAASALADGKFVLAWQDRVTVGGDAVIKAQIFDGNRDLVGAAVSFTPPPGNVESMNITWLSDGGFALLLTMDNGTDKDVYVATCSATGTVLIPPSLVGTSAAGHQTDPEIVALAGGSFVVSWMNGANGTLMTEVFGADPSSNTAAQLTNLNGDVVSTTPGGTTFIDKDSNSILTDDGAINTLIVQMWDGGEKDHLEIRTQAGGIELSNGLKPQSKLSIGNQEIGVMGDTLDQWLLQIHFKPNTTAAQVQEILHALIYRNSSTAGDLRAERHILLRIVDDGGKFTSAGITVSVAPAAADAAPTNIRLTSGGTTASVEENKTGGFVVATVTADDDGGTTGLRYALTDGTFEIDAVTGQIRVKAGAVLDYERASTHTLSVTVTDKNGSGLSASQTVTVKVSDLLESQQGTSGKNVLTGGIGADKLNGGSGNDTLTGDEGTDIFVFNTALGKGTTPKNQNKKVNFDTITDFTPGQDKIWLDNKIFAKLGKAGSEAAPASLNKKFFKMTKATDANDYIIYKNGIVSYDADGSGTRYKPVEIIKIANKAKLSAADFLVI